MIKQLMTGLVLTSLTCNLALAGDKGHRGAKHGRLDHARVVNVEPIIETLSHKTPRESCWNERVRYEERGSAHHSAAPAIIGGLVGAAIGNSLGERRHRSNRAIKAVALGALGATIGNEIGRHQRRQNDVSYRNERRCEVSYETSYEERIVGYDVSYRYRGETYQTRMDYDPGNRIPVRVNVRPVM